MCEDWNTSQDPSESWPWSHAHLELLNWQDWEKEVFGAFWLLKQSNTYLKGKRKPAIKEKAKSSSLLYIIVITTYRTLDCFFPMEAYMTMFSTTEASPQTRWGFGVRCSINQVRTEFRVFSNGEIFSFIFLSFQSLFWIPLENGCRLSALSPLAPQDC